MNLHQEYPPEITALYVLRDAEAYRQWRYFCWTVSSDYVDLNVPYQEALERAYENVDVVFAAAYMLASDMYRPLELLKITPDDVVEHFRAAALAVPPLEAAERVLWKAIQLCYDIPFRLTPEPETLGLQGAWRVFPNPCSSTGWLRLQREAVYGRQEIRQVEHLDALYVAVSLEEVG